MGIRDYLPSLGSTPGVHYECRSCGRNLEEHREHCPACEGRVVVYDL